MLPIRISVSLQQRLLFAYRTRSCSFDQQFRVVCFLLICIYYLEYGFEYFVVLPELGRVGLPCSWPRFCFFAGGLAICSARPLQRLSHRFLDQRVRAQRRFAIPGTGWLCRFYFFPPRHCHRRAVCFVFLPCVSVTAHPTNWAASGPGRVAF